MAKRLRSATLFFFHGALQRVLVAAGEIHDLGHFGLGDFMAKDANNSQVVLLQHDGVDWRLKRSLELDYCGSNHNDTLAASALGLHVTSWCNNNVLLYDFNGAFKR